MEVAALGVAEQVAVVLLVGHTGLKVFAVEAVKEHMGSMVAVRLKRTTLEVAVQQKVDWMKLLAAIQALGHICLVEGQRMGVHYMGTDHVL